MEVAKETLALGWRGRSSPWRSPPEQLREGLAGLRNKVGRVSHHRSLLSGLLFFGSDPNGLAFPFTLHRLLDFHLAGLEFAQTLVQRGQFLFDLAQLGLILAAR